MNRAITVATAGLLGFIALDALIFRTSLYPYILSPDASTGYVEQVLNNELWRVKTSTNQILAIGDSRMALTPRIANEFTNQTGYTYASIGVGGATPRDWYYMLRTVDPDGNRYRAVIATIDSYDDDENPENYAGREADLNYVIAHLGLSDLREFSMSYPTPELQWRAARGILFKGFVYKRDLQDFLLHPIDRFNYVQLSRRDSHGWFYGFVGPTKSLAGLTVDWGHKTLTSPPGLDAERISALKRTLLDPLPPDQGHRSAYLKYWLNRVYDLYRNSATQLVFVRVPRGPWIRPDLPSNPNSSIRRLAKQVNVSVLREDLMNPLEKPEFFQDEFHLNQAGLEHFTKLVELEMRSVMGPL